MTDSYLKKKLKEAHGKLCPYCTRPMDKENHRMRPTSDHIKAKSKREKEEKGRRIVVCSQCNAMKDDLSLEQFIIDLQRRNAELLDIVEVNLTRMRNIRYLLDIGLEE